MLQHYKQRVALNLPIAGALTHEINMEVAFGTPTQNCIGSGVCMIMNRLPRHRRLQFSHAPAWTSYKKENLMFRFPKLEIVREDEISRFNSQYFLVYESFHIPRHVALYLGQPSAWVGLGIYLMKETVKDWILAFRLKAPVRSKVIKCFKNNYFCLTGHVTLLFNGMIKKLGGVLFRKNLSGQPNGNAYWGGGQQ
ncbi:MAG: hypothetical protein ACKV1O_28355 [Saprospiraceae bacterium]